jgi:DNA-binding NtrC family response regulator
MAKIVLCQSGSPDLLSQALQAAGHEVRLVQEFDQARRVVRSFKPEALITDWGIEGEGCGLELAETFRTDSAAGPVFICTDYPTAVTELCLQSGINGIHVVTRPYSVEGVVNIVAKALAERPARAP